MNINDLLDMVNETIALAKKMNCFRLLCILAEADLKAVTTVDFYSLPKEVTKIIEAQGLHEYNFKRALIGSKDQELLKFYETVTLNAGYRMRLFYDIEEAKQWLQEG